MRSFEIEFYKRGKKAGRNVTCYQWNIALQREDQNDAVAVRHKKFESGKMVKEVKVYAFYMLWLSARFWIDKVGFKKNPEAAPQVPLWM